MIHIQYKSEEVNHIEQVFKNEAKNILQGNLNDISIAARTDFGLIIDFPSFFTKSYKELVNIVSSINDTQLFFQNGKKKNVKNLKSAWRKLYDAYTPLLQTEVYDSKGIKKKLNVLMVESLGVRTCPYCNRVYIDNRGDRNVAAQFDHFYPRSEYPIFSLCLYNLVPSCNVCNNIKRNKRLSISPYDSTVDLDKMVRFSFTPLESDFLINQDSILIDIRTLISDSAFSSYEDTITFMKIREAYALDRDYVSELLKKIYMYNDETIEQLISTYPDLNLSQNEALRIIYGNYLSSEEYTKRPLSKLTHDILMEFGIV